MKWYKICFFVYGMLLSFSMLLRVAGHTFIFRKQYLPYIFYAASSMLLLFIFPRLPRSQKFAKSAVGILTSILLVIGMLLAIQQSLEFDQESLSPEFLNVVPILNGIFILSIVILLKKILVDDW